MCDSVLEGVISGVIASGLVIFFQIVYEYQKNKNYEKRHLYEFDSFEVDECAPVEYARESCNSGDTKVKVILPFDISVIWVYIDKELIYHEKNIPEFSPIYICCYCDLFGEKEVVFTIKCVTSNHECREYEYKKIYTIVGKPIGYALKMKRQKFKIFL